tara:strand:+ start:82 stop:612 length:531 start_codon:yes stop_codon:yes gene_type:complete
MTLASYVTSLRVLLILPIMYCMSYEYEYSALILFLLAGFTDYLDGYIARRTLKETSLGALLDLLADKLLVCLVLIWCAILSESVLIIIATLIIITRELMISSLRQFLVEKTGENIVKVTYIAKGKTTIQIIAISFLILSPEMGNLFYISTVFLIWIAAWMSIYTLYNYFKNYSQYL